MSRALASLGRFPEAHDAFNHTVTPAAEDEFAKAPDDPRSRYYACRGSAATRRPRRSQKEIGRPAGECSLRCSVAPNRR